MTEAPLDRPRLFLREDEVVPDAPEVAAPHLFAPLEGTSRILPEETEWPPHWQTLCWISAAGLSVEDAAFELGFAPSALALTLQDKAVAAKIIRLREEYFGVNLDKQFTQAAPSALAHMKRVIKGEFDATAATRYQASQWVLEKVTGKPKQDISVGGEINILHVLQEIQKSKEVKAVAAPAATKDIELKKADWMDTWVSDNVPELASEKSDG